MCGQEGCHADGTPKGSRRPGLWSSLFCSRQPESANCSDQYCDPSCSARAAGANNVPRDSEPPPSGSDSSETPTVPELPTGVPPVPQIPQAEPGSLTPAPTDFRQAIPTPDTPATNSALGVPQNAGDIPKPGTTNDDPAKRSLTPEPQSDSQSLVEPANWPKLRTPSVATPIDGRNFYPNKWMLR